MAGRWRRCAPTISPRSRSASSCDAIPALADSVDEVYLGCANQAGEDNRNVARMALLLAGLPETVPGVTLNRLCASGMDAVGAAARAIKAGEIDLAIAGGVESMTRAPLVMGKAETAFQRTAEIHDTTIGWRFVNPLMKAQYGVDSMPETGENVGGGLPGEPRRPGRLRAPLAGAGGAGDRRGRVRRPHRRGRDCRAGRARRSSTATSIRAPTRRSRRSPR